MIPADLCCGGEKSFELGLGRMEGDEGGTPIHVVPLGLHPQPGDGAAPFPFGFLSASELSQEGPHKPCELSSRMEP